MTAARLPSVDRPPGGLSDALASDPASPPAEHWAQWAARHASAGRFSDALACIDCAARLEPLRARLHNQHAAILRALGRHAEALAAVARAVKLQPDDAETGFNLAQALAALDRHEVAVPVLEKLAARLPNSVMIQAQLGRSLNALRRHAEALAALDRALALGAADADLLALRGNLLLALQRVPEALDCLRLALQQQPEAVQPNNDHGNALFALGRYDEALGAYRQALERWPQFLPAACNLAVTLWAQRRFAAATDAFERALRLAPDDAITRFNLAAALLSRGDLAGGFAHFEARWRLPGFEPERHAAVARWRRGAPIADRRILLWSEQGLGDTIHFCRYAPLVSALGATVALEVEPPLATLLETLPGSVRVVARGEPVPAVDLQAPLMSLPAILGTQIGSIPDMVPYLRAPADRVTAWTQRLGAGRQGLRVGVPVSGRATFMNDFNRSLPLRLLRPLQDTAELYLLQTDVRPNDEAELLDGRVRDLRNELRDLADTAALVECLDLVICVDTAAAHLAGALGRPVWILLPYLPDWRWLLDREDSPWYPTARLFRQAVPGDWQGVIGRVCGELGRFAGGRR